MARGDYSIDSERPKAYELGPKGAPRAPFPMSEIASSPALLPDSPPPAGRAADPQVADRLAAEPRRADGPRDFDALVRALEPLRRQLVDHELYRRLRTADDLSLFTSHHVFAVWDFMSLLKSLQRELTCVEVPWTPKGSPTARRAINQMVLAEESDLLPDGRVLSHLELYREAMGQLGADLGPIDDFLARIERRQGVVEAITQAGAPCHARSFVQSTWRIVKSRSVPMIAAAFTLGREDVIPEMFRGIVAHLNTQSPERTGALSLYLERHVELDGDEHGPAAARLLVELLGDDANAWADAHAAARASLKARIALWDGVLAQIRSPSSSAAGC